jgi:hypothetical protein
MESYWLRFKLYSDATFGRGEGLAGVVNQEVEHDEWGLPYLRGRALKGLLNEECANILFALEQQGTQQAAGWEDSAHRLWGGPGSRLDDSARLRVGDARLPQDLRLAVRQAIRAGAMTAQDALESLTTIRRQTSVDEQTGAPRPHSLRAARAVLRETVLEAALTFVDDAQPGDLALLAACVLALRRAGTARNRGRGRLQASLHADQDGHPGQDITRDQFELFAQEVQP